MLFPFVLNIIPWSLGIGEYEFRASNCDQWILQACYGLFNQHNLQTIMTDYDNSMVPTEAGVDSGWKRTRFFTCVLKIGILNIA
jgi:hypothetical protein